MYTIIEGLESFTSVESNSDVEPESKSDSNFNNKEFANPFVLSYPLRKKKVKFQNIQKPLSQALRCALDILPVAEKWEQKGQIINFQKLKIRKVELPLDFCDSTMSIDLNHWTLSLPIITTDGSPNQANVQHMLQAIQQATACDDPILQIIERTTSFAQALVELNQNISQIACFQKSTGPSLEALTVDDACEIISVIIREIDPNASILFYLPINTLTVIGNPMLILRFEVLARTHEQFKSIHDNLSTLMKDNQSCLYRSSLGPFIDEVSYTPPLRSPFEYCENDECIAFLHAGQDKTLCEECQTSMKSRGHDIH